ncbi:MAG: hypothetical protein ACODAC_11420 [Pseudomonadota bacterium]
MKEVSAIRVTVPEKDLERLSFCETTASALAEWVVDLPMRDSAEAAARAHRATSEVARLDVGPDARLALLEQVRPMVHYLCTRLDRGAAGDGAAARLAQRLEADLCAGYKAVVLDSGRATGEDVLPLAIHRALSDLSRTLLRASQFYVAPPEGLWLELNQLYLLAERMDLAELRIEDAENHSAPVTAITEAYLRPVLFACARPNQLRYRQLAELFNCLEEWAQHVVLAADATASLFAVDLESDRGPVHARALRGATDPRGVRTESLVRQLDAYRRCLPTTLRVPDGMSDAEVHHLADAWGRLRPRSHRRLDASGTIKICTGLRAAHYAISGWAEPSGTTDPPAEPRGEVDPFHADAAAEQGPAPTGLRIYDASAVNASPGGYRIDWNDPLPVELQTGELIALREPGDEHWCLAVVRWIRHDDHGSTTGLALLAPRATPVAIRGIRKLGGPAAFTPALTLPAIPPLEEPATLLTPHLPFESGQKVQILCDGVRTTAQLTACTLETGSVMRFTYRMLSGYLENGGTATTMTP